MECPYCGAELRCIDYYGKTKYSEHYWIYPHSWIEKTGDIYQCPNIEGFKTSEDAFEYAKNNPENIEDFGVNSHWEEICCDSATFNGHFYTDSNDNLYEGYPC